MAWLNKAIMTKSIDIDSIRFGQGLLFPLQKKLQRVDQLINYKTELS